ncbi:MAG: ABC transporter ATP-binding protein [Chloroflexota bacterium]
MIEVHDVSFAYPGTPKPAITNLDFVVQQGEIFGFLGPSGAGKSTTQKILIGLLRGYHGTISVLGKDLTQWGSAYYENIGVSFELPNHFLKLTALENLTYFGALYRRSTHNPQEVLELVGLGEDGQVPVSQYSKGMKNRLTLARALLHNPDILFLDEPTSGLDPVNARRVKDLIKEQQQAGKTIFLTTHNMTIADELCDRVAFITDGVITLIDTPRTLKLNHGQSSVQVEYQQNGHNASEQFDLSGLGDNGDFIRLLKTGLVQTIHTQEATLEDIFIQVSGRSLA